MQCFVYKSSKKSEMYLYIAKKDDFSVVPETLLTNLGRLEFVVEFELTPERKLAREKTETVIMSLNNKGFFLQMPPVKLTGNSNLH